MRKMTEDEKSIIFSTNSVLQLFGTLITMGLLFWGIVSELHVH